MALSYEVGTDGSVLWAGGELPIMLPGRVAALGDIGMSFALENAAPSGLSEGDRVVLSLTGETPVRVTAKVVGIESGGLLLSTGAYQHLNRREYPRIDAPVSLQWRLSGSANQRLSPPLVKVFSQWSRPLSPTVNLSVAGLAFVTAYHVPASTAIELKITIGGPRGGVYEVPAEVVRTTDAVFDDGLSADADADADADMFHRVAVQFTNLSEATRRAFVQYTLACQNEALGIENEDQA